MRCPAFQVSVSLVITSAGSPAAEPRNCPSTGAEITGGQAVGVEQRGSTWVIFGVLHAHGGKIAEEKRSRSPVAGSVRLSLTRGTVTSTAPALVSTSLGWSEPLRTTRR